MAKVIFSLIRQMFRFAVARDFLQVDPTASISKISIGGSNVERDRVLSEDEIIELAKKLADANMKETSIIAILIVNGKVTRILKEHNKQISWYFRKVFGNLMI